MKYLKIRNNGCLDVRLISLMGGTTKTGDQFKIGRFSRLDVPFNFDHPNEEIH